MKRRVAAVLVLVVLIAVGGLQVYRIYLKHVATEIVSRSANLVVGKSTFQDAQRLANEYRSRVSTEWLGPPIAGEVDNSGRNTCSPRKCSFNIRVKNDKLVALSLASPTELMATIVVINDRVELVQVSLSTIDGAKAVAGGVQYSDNWNSWLPISDYTLWSPVPTVLNAIVTNGTSPERKERAFHFSMKCLAEFRKNCKNPGDIVPLVWEDWHAMQKKRGANWLGLVATPAGGPHNP